MTIRERKKYVDHLRYMAAREYKYPWAPAWQTMSQEGYSEVSDELEKIKGKPGRLSLIWPEQSPSDTGLGLGMTNSVLRVASWFHVPMEVAARRAYLSEIFYSGVLLTLIPILFGNYDELLLPLFILSVAFYGGVDHSKVHFWKKSDGLLRSKPASWTDRLLYFPFLGAVFRGAFLAPLFFPLLQHPFYLVGAFFAALFLHSFWDNHVARWFRVPLGFPDSSSNQFYNEHEARNIWKIEGNFFSPLPPNHPLLRMRSHRRGDLTLEKVNREMEIFVQYFRLDREIVSLKNVQFSPDIVLHALHPFITTSEHWPKPIQMLFRRFVASFILQTPPQEIPLRLFQINQNAFYSALNSLVSKEIEEILFLRIIRIQEKISSFLRQNQLRGPINIFKFIQFFLDISRQNSRLNAFIIPVLVAMVVGKPKEFSSLEQSGSPVIPTPTEISSIENDPNSLPLYLSRPAHRLVAAAS
jgi:hypothetical protein